MRSSRSLTVSDDDRPPLILVPVLPPSSPAPSRTQNTPKGVGFYFCPECYAQHVSCPHKGRCLYCTTTLSPSSSPHSPSTPSTPGSAIYTRPRSSTLPAVLGPRPSFRPASPPVSSAPRLKWMCAVCQVPIHLTGRSSHVTCRSHVKKEAELTSQQIEDRLNAMKIEIQHQFRQKQENGPQLLLSFRPLSPESSFSSPAGTNPSTPVSMHSLSPPDSPLPSPPPSPSPHRIRPSVSMPQMMVHEAAKDTAQTPILHRPTPVIPEANPASSPSQPSFATVYPFPLHGSPFLMPYALPSSLSLSPPSYASSKSDGVSSPSGMSPAGYSFAPTRQPAYAHLPQVQPQILVHTGPYVQQQQRPGQFHDPGTLYAGMPTTSMSPNLTPPDMFRPLGSQPYIHQNYDRPGQSRDSAAEVVCGGFSWTQLSPSQIKHRSDPALIGPYVPRMSTPTSPYPTHPSVMTSPHMTPSPVGSTSTSPFVTPPHVVGYQVSVSPPPTPAGVPLDMQHSFLADLQAALVNSSSPSNPVRSAHSGTGKMRRSQYGSSSLYPPGFRPRHGVQLVDLAHQQSEQTQPLHHSAPHLFVASMPSGTTPPDPVYTPAFASNSMPNLSPKRHSPRRFSEPVVYQPQSFFDELLGDPVSLHTGSGLMVEHPHLTLCETFEPSTMSLSHTWEAHQPSPTSFLPPAPAPAHLQAPDDGTGHGYGAFLWMDDSHTI
eukprot:TRINITY_DN10349_c0_g1_i4.p1 TRINITY_DN10349_c0_g1~~TRINITY_DN10349_c0_g1_i4.p1  ORF type:complete len:711 (-),score=145.46 TRINITY_DN10349_c0_g1_i4:123-2255(-)